MKKMFKKVMVTLMTAALLMGVLAVPVQKAQAASKKLTEDDFKQCKTANGNYNFISQVKQNTGWFYQEYCGSGTALKQTKRGIRINSTRAQVFGKYGKATVKQTATVIKNKTEKDIYNRMKSSDSDFKAGSTKKFVEYKLDKRVSGRTLLLRFYLNSSNKVSVVAFIAK